MSKILSIFPIPAFQDNYIWLIDTNEGYIVVDPGDANPVIDKLGRSINKDLTILITLMLHKRFIDLLKIL